MATARWGQTRMQLRDSGQVGNTITPHGQSPLQGDARRPDTVARADCAIYAPDSHPRYCQLTATTIPVSSGGVFNRRLLTGLPN
jgi:hypothetical protein